MPSTKETTKKKMIKMTWKETSMNTQWSTKPTFNINKRHNLSLAIQTTPMQFLPKNSLAVHNI